MKRQLLKFIVALPVMLIGLLANGQVTTKTFKAGIPAALIETGIKDIPDIFIKAPAEFNKILKYGDNDNPHELRFRFGVAKKVSADVLSNAKIIKEKGCVTYLTTVTAENALSISLQFGKFFIPKDAIMRIYSNNEITDDITSNVNNGKTTWATRIYHGNSITISLKVPTAAQDKAILEINKVCFGFKEINGEICGDDRHGNVCRCRAARHNTLRGQRYRQFVWLVLDAGHYAGDRTCR